MSEPQDVRTWSKTTPHDGHAFLKKAEISEVFEAACSPKRGIALPADADRREVILRAGKTLIGQMVFAAMEQDKLDPDAAEAIARAFRRLETLMSKVPALCGGAPPGIPSHWSDSMSEWAAIHASDEAKKKGPEWFPIFAYPKIFGLYASAFGKPPGQTLNGPAVRFTTAVFEAALRSVFPGQDDDSVKLADRARGNLAVPSPETIRKKLGEVRPDRVWAEEIIARQQAQLTTYAPWDTVEQYG